MKRTLLTLSILALSSSAFALGDATYNQGGSAVAAPVSNATGGSVLGSGNSANANTNTNVLGQQQGQGQAQGQTAIGVGFGGGGGQGGASSSSSGSSSTSGATSNSGGNTLSQVGGAQTSTQANAVTVTGDTVTYQAQDRNPVSSAYAANLTSANGTCQGSTSGGAQGASFGFSIGSTWVDAGCDARYDSMALAAAGLKAAATARLCMKAEIAQAMANAGTPCKAAKPAASVAQAGPVAPAVSAPQVPATGYTGNDPYVLKRLAR